MIIAFFEQEQIREKENWKRTRWLATWIVNTAGKSFSKTFGETELGIKFKDEMIKVDPEERERQAMETIEYHAKMFPNLIKRNKDGKPRIYGRDN